MPTLRCPRCDTVTEVPFGKAAKCPSCGKLGPATHAPKMRTVRPKPAPVVEEEAAWTIVEKPAHTGGYSAYMNGNPPTEGMGLAALLVNILAPFVFPLAVGAGTLIGGRIQEGLIQLGSVWGLTLLLVLTVVTGPFTFFLSFVLVLPLIILAGIGIYVWSIVSGAQILNDARHAQAPVAA